MSAVGVALAAQGRGTGLSGPFKGLRSTCLALVVAGLPTVAFANDCFRNQDAPYAMLEVQRMAQQQVGSSRQLGWYSTSSTAQAQVAFDEMIQYARHMRSVQNITQIHILSINSNGALVLYGDGAFTCGFSKPVIIDGVSAEFAVNSANAVFDQEQARQNATPATGLDELQPWIRKRIDAMMYLMDYGWNTSEAESYCGLLEFDHEIGVVPELEEIEVNDTFRGQPARLLPHNARIKTLEAERFLSNAVGYDHAKGLWRIDGIILLTGPEETDILITMRDKICGLNGALVVPNDWIETLLTTPHEPTRSTLPGDPLLNMTEEERRAWQLFQGIGQSGNPLQRLQDLYDGAGQ